MTWHLFSTAEIYIFYAVVVSYAVCINETWNMTLNESDNSSGSLYPLSIVCKYMIGKHCNIYNFILYISLNKKKQQLLKIPHAKVLNHDNVDYHIEWDENIEEEFVEEGQRFKTTYVSCSSWWFTWTYCNFIGIVRKNEMKQNVIMLRIVLKAIDFNCI